jgi:hypothetical protein
MERASTARIWTQSGAALAAALVWWLHPAAAAAQRLLDLNPRTSTGAESLAEGAPAVFWNPAGIGVLVGRGEASVIDVRGPESTGLGGLAIAAALRLDARTTAGLGFQHAGIDGIERTSDSPLPEDARGTIDLGEDALTAAVARDLGASLSIGVAVHYLRAADLVQVDDAVEFAAGMRFRPALPLAPAVAIAAHVERDVARWRAGIEVAPLRMAGGDWTVTAGYGADAGGRATGVGHRVATAARYRDRALVSIGAVGGGVDEDFGWAPVASAELRLARYVVGILRESLANGFGAVHALRFSIRF